MVMSEQNSHEAHIEAQRRRIEFLEKENSRLQEANGVLKASLTHQTIEAERSYRDNIGKFDALFKQIYPVVAEINKIWERPATYDEIIKSFQRQHPDVAKAETISRRVREMVADGWLETPQRGSFIVVKNPNP